MRPKLRTTATVLLAGSQAHAAVFSIDSTDAIKKSASILAHDLVAYYHGNESGQTPGILPGPPPAGPYYWWEAGAMWGTLIDYWHWTGDATYNDLVTQAMLWQVGPHADYMPPNVTMSLGNDDQGFWGMSAMLAAEVNFPNPPPTEPQWLALAQAVFNTQAEPGRHDNTFGDGIANGCFFNLGARLARYTNNQTYADWAEQTWDWIQGVGYMDAQYNIYDGAHIDTNCTDINRAQFSYNGAVWLLGAAYMWNHTEDGRWRARVEGLLDRTLTFFFPDGVAFEVACERPEHMSCTTDMLTYKGFLHRWLATATQLAPFAHDRVLATLRNSTRAAVAQCTGGDAVGDPDAGSHSTDNPSPLRPITTADRVGAGFLTAVILLGVTGMFGVISLGEMPIPDLADRTRFPPFLALPEERDSTDSSADADADDNDSPCLLAQITANMTINKPTLVLADRDGHPFALVFDGLGRDELDLAGRGLKKGATAVVHRARQSVPQGAVADAAGSAAAIRDPSHPESTHRKAAKRPFVRIPAGQAHTVQAVGAPLDRVVPAAAALRRRQQQQQKQARGSGTCDACGALAAQTRRIPTEALRKCTGCGQAWYCNRACQTKGWSDGHKDECKAWRGLVAIWGG
ncbi:Glycoside hydrolase, family 76 [Niveomyces insectorum RCEF 264]|uniref:mannan endo-1,6-alpha-mannosidase n=1 Tax=Niveomyces insectorum RCEF 264 TaxID=1081102 RepID=A0A162MTB7_9HYPO|nr:Glycoside hydrolase, family 76 [Niveomyces insectorum RCEF 264]